MYDTETQQRPTLPTEAFDRMAAVLESDGGPAAIEKLLVELREAEDFDSYFYALLMKKRLELGLSPFPTGPAADIPEAVQSTYEDGIRDAGREVGSIYLKRGEIPRAFVFYRMLGEEQVVKDAIDAFEPDPEADCEDVIQVAFHQGIHPEKGFDLILDRYGICSAITMASSQDFAQRPELYSHCVRGLVRSLSEQLAERLRMELQEHGDTVSEDASVAEMVKGRDWLFADDAYHIDVSHLSSVVQMSLRLPDCEELKTARELCAYGEKLGAVYRGEGDPPFEDSYRDYGIYLDILLGQDVDAGVEHFKARADAAAEEGYSFPAEIVVNLLVRVNRPAEALAVARKHLLNAEERELSCPSVYDLCHRANDYKAMAEIAKERGEGVPYLAALVRQQVG